jgi:hypothetical protein
MPISLSLDRAAPPTPFFTISQNALYYFCCLLLLARDHNLWGPRVCLLMSDLRNKKFNEKNVRGFERDEKFE